MNKCGLRISRKQINGVAEKWSAIIKSFTSLYMLPVFENDLIRFRTAFRAVLRNVECKSIEFGIQSSHTYGILADVCEECNLPTFYPNIDHLYTTIDDTGVYLKSSDSSGDSIAVIPPH